MDTGTVDSRRANRTYLKAGSRFPFCKGCGHHHVTHAINDALGSLQLNPNNVNITSDIGCVGLVDALFDTVHTFHTTHGRSTAFATGIELADSILGDSKLKNIVVIGDGGAMIGLLHLVNAAQLNVDVTVILYNNFLFGMTGGQNSSFSPMEFVTATTPRGNIIPPIDIIKILEGANAGFLARKAATDKDLSDTIARAIEYPGFALVEVLELCTEYALRGNSIRGNKLAEIYPGRVLEMGTILNNKERKDFGDAYKEKFPPNSVKPMKEEGIIPKYINAIENQIGLVIAGTAGERVQYSAYLLVQAAVLSGANATQKNDNPVTQGTGFSLSEIVISKNEINYTGIDHPDIIVVVSEDGMKELITQDVFGRTTERTLIISDSSLNLPLCHGSICRLPLRERLSAAAAAFGGIAAAIKLKGIFPIDALKEIVKSQGKAKDLLSVFEVIEGLI
jgi:Pyruvate:ferredoxin oxidoreductase and related 2-oxoacid:ferredoxin oxidoreductases, beta subunit